MKQSNNKHGFTRVDNYVFDVIVPTLSPAEQAIFLRIIRQTVGWSQPTDKIRFSEFRATTAIRDDKTVRKAIDELLKRKLITVAGKPYCTKEYGIDWDVVIAAVQRWHEQMDGE